MNDLEELRFGINEGASELHRSEELREACRTEDNYNKLLGAFDHILEKFDSEYVLNTYVLCFSEHDPPDNDGLLSMWRGYGNGGSGAAIVIDTSKISNVQDSPFIVGKVIYGTKEKRLAWIREKISDLAKVVASHARVDDDFFYAAWAWFTRLKSFALFTKHNGFHEEREWRVVYMSDRDEHALVKPYFGHLVTDRGIEPKLKLPIQPIKGVIAEGVSLEAIVERIILGPSVASVLALNSFKQMLRNTGREALADRVVASGIPFRAFV